MKRRQRFIVGCIIVLTAILAFFAELWYGAELDPDDWRKPFLLIEALLAVALAVFLLPLWGPGGPKVLVRRLVDLQIDAEEGLRGRSASSGRIDGDAVAQKSRPI